LYTLSDFTAPVDATAVHKLREAGAIVIGTANMDEFGMGSFGKNGKNGIVRNPIDPDHFPGGSSAGSAASVKSYSCLGSLGTDTGGSVNYPAHCCGLVSMKPSFGRISRSGQILYSSSNETIGPFAHIVADIHAFFGKWLRLKIWSFLVEMISFLLDQIRFGLTNLALNKNN